MSQDFKIVKKIINSEVILSIFGTINTETSGFLNDELQKLDYSNLDLTIDFLNTDYITSAGLRALLIARKKLTTETMRIINANDSIIDVFKITGFDSFIKIDGINKHQTYVEENNLSFSDLLNLRLSKNASDVAYIYKEKEYTWEDIDAGSTIVAEDLKSLNIKKGTHVGICGTNSINWVFTFFAIQKLNGIAVLINPKLTALEINDLCDIGGVTHLCYSEITGITSFEIYQQKLLSNKSIQHVYDISDRVDFLLRKNDSKKFNSLSNEKHNADDASIIIFTSGSTEKPKAVLSSAFNLYTSIYSLSKNLRLSEKDINLAFLPFFHVFGLETSIVIPLLKGYCSIIPSDSKPASIINLINRYKCTIFNTVPTMLLGIISDSTFDTYKLLSLRVSILGGSAITSEQMTTLLKLLPNTHFGNIYGMSENASIAVTNYDDSIEHLTKTVGKPVEDVEICIRDSSGNSLENGKEGEICIRSKSMLVCYYKLDIEKQPIDENGWLATGDLGYIDNDGYLRLTGRIKDLIISGGENISPGEIAEVIASIPNIADVKVFGIPDEIKGEVVAAAIVLKNGFSFYEAEIRKIVESKLAKYKCPKLYVVIDNMPLLGSGKIDTVTLKKLVTEKIKRK